MDYSDNESIDLLDVELLTKPTFKRDMIQDLVLHDEAKKLVMALSNSYASQADDQDQNMTPRGSKQVKTRWSADFVQNKGEGQIFLLHGKPGVGKTT